MKKLFVIGNGFDLHLDLKTSYISFAKYLKIHHKDIYENLICYFDLPDIKNNDDNEINYLWNELEFKLTTLEQESVLESNSDYISNISENFRDRDWYTFESQIRMFVESVTKEILTALREFIISRKYPKHNLIDNSIITSENIYLSFNYTNSLEHYFKVPESNILYIHGKANNHNSPLILGHNIAPELFIEKPKSPPSGLSSDKLHLWEEQMSEQYNHSYDLGKHELITYFNKSFKKTSDIMELHQDFFTKLKNVESVYILGHSFSDIDYPYFKKIKNSINKSSTWYTHCHTDEDLYNKDKMFKKLEVRLSKTHLVAINELIPIH